MADILKWFSDVANAITGWLNLSEEGMIAVTIGLVIVGIVIALGLYRFIKKKIGKTIALIVLIGVLLGTGFLSFSTFAGFAEKIGMITQSSIGEGMEFDGDAFLRWIEGKSPGEDEGAGTWVPDRDEQDANDWTQKTE